MKANAPERIWIDPASDLSKLSGHIDKDGVEYIRKDAFIKNTCEWIKMMWSETDDRFKEDYTGMLIESFKNYIKGK